MNIKTCEFVSPKHPDKLCDLIADSILDAYLREDPLSRVAVEVMGGHGHISISGEVSSRAKVNIESIVKAVVGEEYAVHQYLVEQSSQIAQGVDTGGAGDQGIMVGYACDETKSLMPKEYELARNLCQKIYEKYPYDGKTQVTLRDGEVDTVVASFQSTESDQLSKLVKETIKARRYLINPAGPWTLGGLDADSGLSGRKIVIDAYGPNVPVGGGSFSGKDYTKVDRSGAYMARKIARDLLVKHSAREVTVRLAYAIGVKDPVMALATLDGERLEITEYDLSPSAIRSFLRLNEQTFTDTAVWGHFGRGFSWDS